LTGYSNLKIFVFQSTKMSTQDKIDYNRIAEAIEYIQENFRNQPPLDKIAQKLNLSPFHFQRLFSEWAGTTPKKFLQYTSVEYAKKILIESGVSLSDTAYETGLSGSSRLHDLFIKIEGMTPAEYRNGGQDLDINYSFAESPFGNLIVASTKRGICYISFQEDEKKALKDLINKFPNASYIRNLDLLQQNALFVFQNDWSKLQEIRLHLKASDFQLKVWESLLKIPLGQLSTYGKIAHNIDKPGASRSVGTAIGSNPVAFLIPCHRVIQSSGVLGGYMWGPARKTAIIGWEAAKIHGSK
jgi:AraC family transcriptional regulator, regulatory protein of adaptative response / methylated-DNA-[protein]-cysteine methyltransferase